MKRVIGIIGWWIGWCCLLEAAELHLVQADLDHFPVIMERILSDCDNLERDYEFQEEFGNVLISLFFSGHLNESAIAICRQYGYTETEFTSKATAITMISIGLLIEQNLELKGNQLEESMEELDDQLKELDRSPDLSDEEKSEMKREILQSLEKLRELDEMFRMKSIIKRYGKDNVELVRTNLEQVSQFWRRLNRDPLDDEDPE